MTKAVRLYQGAFGRASLLDSDHDLVTHAHPQCHVLVKAGGADASYTVRGRTVRLTSDSLVLVNAWEPHAKLQPLPGERTVVLVLCMEPAWLAEHDPLLSGSGMPDFFPAAQVAQPLSLRRLVDRLIMEVLGAAPTGLPNRAVEAALSDFMLAVTHLFALRRNWIDTYRIKMGNRPDARIARAIRYIGDHLDQAITCEELASMHSLSRQHFFSLFRQCTSMSPILYMNTLRMESAFKSLVECSTSVNALADNLGFSEPHHFTRFFRRNLGIPPSQYRRGVSLLA
ncbi:HTH-type transcriptional activator RhaS [Pigmentiphaga humi]|uniref:HTH-type transcriptional activator RhaS n=1 Tax=Pigmentiphaga humi TaxID=2478468 RepID=A0A3P4AY09_9BURK|nr:AraC family transcriptional regulator [Pigmentiphaga humi]VCU68917.1 HTH-type transcriptional activator RhaS [Pigmentiphaga humi]